MKNKFIAILLSCFSPSICFADSFNVMTFNIRYANSIDGENGWEYRKDHVIEVIKDEIPDIIAIQEAITTQLDFLTSQLTHFHKIGEHTRGGEKGEFAGLLVNNEKFEVLDSGQFWLSEKPSKKGSVSWDSSLPRSATWAKLKAKTKGEPFYVIGTHFDHRGKEARLESAKLIIQFLINFASELPVIVMGDLNCEIDSKPMKTFLSSGLKPAVTKNVGGTFHGFNGNHDGRRIDFILLNNKWNVEKSAILRPRKEGKCVSDHEPIIATVQILNEGKSKTDN